MSRRVLSGPDSGLYFRSCGTTRTDTRFCLQNDASIRVALNRPLSTTFLSGPSGTFGCHARLGRLGWVGDRPQMLLVPAPHRRVVLYTKRKILWDTPAIEIGIITSPPPMTYPRAHWDVNVMHRDKPWRGRCPLGCVKSSPPPSVSNTSDIISLIQNQSYHSHMGCMWRL